jgi:hypothetical protein
MRAARRAQGVEVEAVHLGRVAAEHDLHLDRLDRAKSVAQRLEVYGDVPS